MNPTSNGTAAKDTVQGHHLVSTDEAKKAPRGYMTDSRSQEKWKPNTQGHNRHGNPTENKTSIKTDLGSLNSTNTVAVSEM